MKLVSFSRDSEIEVSINPGGSYDVSFKDGDNVRVEQDLPADKAWLVIRRSGMKIPAKFMLEFAELALRYTAKVG